MVILRKLIIHSNNLNMFISTQKKLIINSKVNF